MNKVIFFLLVVLGTITNASAQGAKTDSTATVEVSKTKFFIQAGMLGGGELSLYNFKPTKGFGVIAGLGVRRGKFIVSTNYSFAGDGGWNNILGYSGWYLRHASIIRDLPNTRVYAGRIFQKRFFLELGYTPSEGIKSAGLGLGFLTFIRWWKW